MNVYEIETGITYWVAAPSIAEAMAVIVQTWKDEGCLADVEHETIDIERIPEARWPEVCRDDDAPGGLILFRDLLAKTTRAELLMRSVL